MSDLPAPFGCPMLRDGCVAVKAADLSNIFARLDSVDRTLRGYNGDPGMVGAVNELVKAQLDERVKEIEIEMAAREGTMQGQGDAIAELRRRDAVYASLNGVAAAIAGVIAWFK